MQTLSAPIKDKGINICSSFIQRCISGVSKGYGIFRAWGKNTSGEEKYINSDTSVPAIRSVKLSSRTSLDEIISSGRAGIQGILVDEQEIEMEKHEK